MNVTRARKELDAAGLDLLIASNFENVFYFSGYPVNFTARNKAIFLMRSLSPPFVIIPRDGEPILLIKKPLTQTAKRFSTLKDIRTYIVQRGDGSETEMSSAAAGEALVQLIKDMEPRSIGVENNIPGWLYELLKSRLPRVNIVFATRVFDKIRSLKDEDEIQKLTNATQLTAGAIRASMDRISAGVPEFEVLQAFRKYLVENGGDVSNAKIAAGKFGHVICHQPSDYKIQAGDLILYDVGAFYDGYSSDLGRVASVGKPNGKMEKMYDTLSQAQKAAMEMLRPGVKLSNVFNAGIDIVRKAGYPNYNRDFVGHSIGVELEEEPFITAKSEWVVEAGMVLAVEFPYYEEGMGGLNIEELVLVTKSGAKVLSDGLDRSIRVI